MPFPLALCLAALALNGLALAAAVWGVQWGAAPPRGDALPLAFLYVQVALAASTGLLWPSWALRGGARWVLAWDLGGLALAAIPAAGLAAWVSEVPWAILVRAVGYQAGWAVFVFGVLTWALGSRVRGAWAAGWLAGVFLGVPMLAYWRAEFVPMWPGGWWVISPPLVVAAVAYRQLGNGVWWLALGLAVVGVGLTGIGGTGLRTAQTRGTRLD